jgi:hypothetical protein
MARGNITGMVACGFGIFFCVAATVIMFAVIRSFRAAGDPIHLANSPLQRHEVFFALASCSSALEALAPLACRPLLLQEVAPVIHLTGVASQPHLGLAPLIISHVRINEGVVTAGPGAQSQEKVRQLVK